MSTARLATAARPLVIQISEVSRPFITTLQNQTLFVVPRRHASFVVRRSCQISQITGIGKTSVTRLKSSASASLTASAPLILMVRTRYWPGRNAISPGTANLKLLMSRVLLMTAHHDNATNSWRRGKRIAYDQLSAEGYLERRQRGVAFVGKVK